MLMRRPTLYVPEWFGNAVYIVTVVIVVIGAMIGLSVISGAPKPEAKMEAKPRAVARAPLDTPETAPQLSPLYPTTDYGPPPTLNNAAKARAQARGTDERNAASRRETMGSGWSRRTYNPMFRPDFSH